MDRRDFLLTMGAGTTLAAAPAAPAASPAAQPRSTDDRAYWVGVMQRLADPVLNNLAAGTLKATMPVEQAPDAKRETVTHLEAFGRLLAGIAPWLELAADDSAEGRLRARYADLARR